MTDDGPAGPGRTPAELARLEATVHGRVQGVGFRYFVRTVADDLGVGGWVANATDGTVVCVAEGPRPALRDFAAALAAGPPGSHVERVDVRWTMPVGMDARFVVRSLGHSGD